MDGWFASAFMGSSGRLGFRISPGSRHKAGMSCNDLPKSVWIVGVLLKKNNRHKSDVAR